MLRVKFSSVMQHRATLQLPLSRSTDDILIECIAIRPDATVSHSTSALEGDSSSESEEVTPLKRDVLHVQSISTWAPACIGPYSQVAIAGDLRFLAGGIALPYDGPFYHAS